MRAVTRASEMYQEACHLQVIDSARAGPAGPARSARFALPRWPSPCTAVRSAVGFEHRATTLQLGFARLEPATAPRLRTLLACADIAIALYQSHDVEVFIGQLAPGVPCLMLYFCPALFAVIAAHGRFSVVSEAAQFTIESGWNGGMGGNGMVRDSAAKH